MKAIVQDTYGGPDVLRFADVDPPTIGDDEVLVRVRAAAVHPGDVLMMRGQPVAMRPMFGLRRPRRRTPGFDVAGNVEAVGAGVRDLRPGEEVFGEGNGTCAEYASASPDKLAPKPRDLSFEQAAAVPMSGLTALHALRDVARVHSGQRVLINGASGGIGTFAVQIAAALGAEVTGVCSTRNVDLVRSLGAARVIDYTREDFTRGEVQYDVILDNVANHSLSQLRRALTPHGTLIPNNGTSGGRWLGPLPTMAQALVVSPFVGQHMRLFVSNARRTDLETLTAMIDAGDVTPVIDRMYRLSDAAEALAHVARGHARGKVVITV